MRRDARPFLLSALALGVCVTAGAPVSAQQRPLVTEDPETIGAGRVLIETGFDYAREILFPISGLRGHLLSVPTAGVSVGISSIAEIQVDGGPYRRLTITERRQAPFSGRLDPEAADTTAADDLFLATKIRVVPEGARRPALGVRMMTRLPVASQESGLGHATTDVALSLLVAKTVQSIRVVGNAGLVVLGDPTVAARQDNLLAYGLSVARAVTDAAELVGEIHGRYARTQTPRPGAENHAVMRLGGRYTRGTVRADAAVLLGMTARDPSVGFTAGFTWVFNAFTIP